jgi:hypothetical protein
MRYINKEEAQRDGLLVASPPDIRPLVDPCVNQAPSTAIKMARVLCILFMTSVHAWPGAGRMLAADTFPIVHGFYFIAIEVFGRASVPLLSLMSGLLFVTSFHRRGSSSVLLGKLQTLIVPLLAWSVPMVAILFAEPFITGEPALLWSAMDWLNAFFSITQAPANLPLHFFREIFVMAVYGCLIMGVFRWNRLTGVACALLVALVEQQAGGFLMLRNQIAVFFVAGMLLAMLGRANWHPSWRVVAAAMTCLGLAWSAGIFDGQPQNLLQQRTAELLPRLAVSLLMWRLAYAIAEHASGFRALVLKIEPHIFVVFCSHAIMVKPFGLLAMMFGLSETSAFQPLFLLLQMAVFVGVGVVLSHLLAPWPWLRGKAGHMSMGKAKSGVRPARLERVVRRAALDQASGRPVTGVTGALSS